MPKPHFPSHGGPHIPAWSNQPTHSPSVGNSKKAESVVSESRRQRELQAEVERLRQELEVARQPWRLFSSHPGAGNHTMVWTALALCGVGMLFALFAILNHG